MTSHRTGAALPPFQVDVTDEALSRWLIARDGAFCPKDRLPVDVPATFCSFLRIQPALGVSVHRLLDRDPDRGLYGGATYEAMRPLRRGDRLTCNATINERRQVEGASGPLTLSSLVAMWSTASGPSVRETVRMVDLPPGPPASPALGPAPELDAVERRPVPAVSAVAAAWMTVVTGDLNPLHLDRGYAASRLFPDIVVPGTLVIPVIERELEVVLGNRPRRLEVRLRAAMFPGEALELRLGRIADGALPFELLGNGRIRATGTAAVGP